MIQGKKCNTNQSTTYERERTAGRSERFSIKNAAGGDGEAGGLVDAMRKGVVNIGVGGHFAAALFASPVFGGV
jgi:hypothetical protein